MPIHTTPMLMCNIMKNQQLQMLRHTRRNNLKAGTAAENALGKRKWLLKLLTLKWDEQGDLEEGCIPCCISSPWQNSGRNLRMPGLL